jgi:hypothetical protein
VRAHEYQRRHGVQGANDSEDGSRAISGQQAQGSRYSRTSPRYGH